MADWNVIVERHGPQVWRAISRLVSHEADAADCFQEVFLAAWKLASQETVLSWSACLQRLAYVKAMDCLRRRYRDGAATLTRETAIPAPTHPCPAEASEFARSLAAALTTIDARQAETFCLHCIEGFSYQEIAITLGVTVNHVGVLLSRARDALRQRMAQHAPVSSHTRDNS